MKVICSTVFSGSVQKSRGALVLQQCLCWTDTASSTCVITLITGEDLWDACGRLLRIPGGICETCLWSENMTINSVMLQPGAGFSVWLTLVVITSLWGCELSKNRSCLWSKAWTLSLNVILGLFELGFSGFCAVNLQPHLIKRHSITMKRIHSAQILNLPAPKGTLVLLQITEQRKGWCVDGHYFVSLSLSLWIPYL